MIVLRAVDYHYLSRLVESCVKAVTDKGHEDNACELKHEAEKEESQAYAAEVVEPEEGSHEKAEITDAEGKHLRKSQLLEPVEPDLVGVVHLCEEEIYHRKHDSDQGKGSVAEESLHPAGGNVPVPYKCRCNECYNQTYEGIDLFYFVFESFFFRHTTLRPVLGFVSAIFNLFRFQKRYIIFGNHIQRLISFITLVYSLFLTYANL